jgi:hypothetical protein
MAEKSGFKPVAGQSHQQNVDALLNLYKDRYGSIENFKNSLYTDPVGVLADVATLASGVGAAGKGVQLAADAGKLTKSPTSPAQWQKARRRSRQLPIL